MAVDTKEMRELLESMDPVVGWNRDQCIAALDELDEARFQLKRAMRLAMFYQSCAECGEKPPSMESALAELDKAFERERAKGE